MKVTYDGQAGALDIRLLEGEYECRTVRVSDDVALDFGPGNRLVGIEILGASRLFRSPEAPEIELEGLLPRVAAPSS